MAKDKSPARTSGKTGDRAGAKTSKAVVDSLGSLGDYLKEQRINARLSLRQLAEQAGVSNPYLSQIERGLRKPSAEILQAIATGALAATTADSAFLDPLPADPQTPPGWPDAWKMP